jgi:hypothetical protein
MTSTHTKCNVRRRALLFGLNLITEKKLVINILKISLNGAMPALAAMFK